MMRLDKLLAHAGFGTRKEVKQLLKDKRVSVNASTQVRDKSQVDEVVDCICVDGEVLSFVKHNFIMLNKPEGVITATSDTQHQTVMDCFDCFIGNDMFPVGRLDIDTQGLVLLCNDGKLAHRLLSPKQHVHKMYEVHIAHPLLDGDVEKLEQGLDLLDFTTLPAIVESIEENVLHLSIQEGKFHQIKRMMLALDNEVVFLKRLTMGPLTLDENLQPGEWRYLQQEEIHALRSV